MGSTWLILLAVLAYGFVHSLLALPAVKGRFSRWFGSLAARSYRLLYNIFAVVSFLPVLLLVWLLPDNRLYAIPFPWYLVTLAGQIAAAILLFVGLFQTGIGSFLGLQQLFQDASGQKPTLVVKGLYRYVRHPLYTAGLAFIWLTPVMTINLLAMNIGLTIYIVIGAWFEERKLLAEFGAAYTEYRACTPMLIPGLQLAKLNRAKRATLDQQSK